MHCGDSAAVMTVLSMIHLSPDKKMEEAVMWRQLAHIGVDRDNHHHPNFNKIEEQLAKMEQMRYLVKTKSSVAQADGPPEHLYEWGENATSLLKGHDIKNFIDGVFNAQQAKMNRAGPSGAAEDDGEPIILLDSDED
eukprot:gene7155-263_t